MKAMLKKLHIPVSVLILLGAILLLLIAAAGYRYLGIRKESVTVPMDQYYAGNEVLYDEVVGYLTNTLKQEEEQSKGVATTAVDNYATIVSSGITALNRSHTEAVLQNVKRSILENIIGAEQMSTEELDLVAANITEMILINIIKQLEGLSDDARASKEYEALYQSINDETSYLSDHEFKITITASINDAYIDSAVLLDAISNMTDEERAYFAQQLAEIQGNTLRPEVLEWLNQIHSLNDLKGETGAQGVQGAQGAKGDTGARGARGETGAQGAKGETGAQGPQGVKGADGYTPVKGVDYFTAADISAITDQATTILETTLGDQVTYTYDPDTKTLYINSVGSEGNEEGEE